MEETWAERSATATLEAVVIDLTAAVIWGNNLESVCSRQNLRRVGLFNSAIHASLDSLFDLRDDVTAKSIQVELGELGGQDLLDIVGYFVLRLS